MKLYEIRHKICDMKNASVDVKNNAAHCHHIAL